MVRSTAEPSGWEVLTLFNRRPLFRIEGRNSYEAGFGEPQILLLWINVYQSLAYTCAPLYYPLYPPLLGSSEKRDINFVFSIR